MSGTRKHDWDRLIKEYVLEKRVDGKLSKADFFRRRGMNIPRGCTRIGKEMDRAWNAVRAKALEDTVQKVGLDLAVEIERQLRIGKAAMTAGARNILPRVADDGSEIPAPQKPTTFAENLALTKLGVETVREAIKLMTGGEALVPKKQVQGAIKWIAPRTVNVKPAAPPATVQELEAPDEGTSSDDDEDPKP